ncbi:MAG: hypothetical protein OIF56_01725 [Cohaesibacter sp.]|nr:hypothetical protein [Cohaesibacter sp.]MCV6601353.1 hypothetical protein [Cohaesibacter sp.]
MPWKKSLIGAAFGLLILGFALFQTVRSQLEPLVRSDPSQPIFTIGETASYDPALRQGKSVVKFGPLLFGLYPGGLAFASQQDGEAYLRDKGWDLEKWAIYRLSGDYAQDVDDGFLNKSLLVVSKVP